MDRGVPGGECSAVDDGREHLRGGSRDFLRQAVDGHALLCDLRNANGAVSKIVRIQLIRPPSTPNHSHTSWVPAGVRVTMSYRTTHSSPLLDRWRTSIRSTMFQRPVMALQ